jgi:hypothetical protein
MAAQAAFRGHNVLFPFFGGENDFFATTFIRKSPAHSNQEMLLTKRAKKTGERRNN